MLTDNTHATDITFTYNLLTIVEQTGLLTVNGSTSLLTLLTLQTFCLLTLLEHTTITGLHWYKRSTIPLTLD